MEEKCVFQMRTVIDCQNILTVNNSIRMWLLTIETFQQSITMHLRQLSTVETIEIHYQNAHFFHLLQPFGVFYVL